MTAHVEKIISIGILVPLSKVKNRPESSILSYFDFSENEEN